MTNEELTQAVFALCRNVPDLVKIKVEHSEESEFPTFKPKKSAKATITHGFMDCYRIEQYFFPNCLDVCFKEFRGKLEKIKLSPIVEQLSNTSQL